MSEPAATYSRDGHVATITYNRPDALNAVNGDMREALDAAWTRFREDEEAWVGIVTGAGRAFCAGADLRDGRGSTGSLLRKWDVRFDKDLKRKRSER